MSVGGVVVLGGHTAWTRGAACAGQFELFDTAAALPVSASATRVRLHDRAVVAARTICRTCPVLRRCEAESVGQDVGFWAAMTEAERDTRWYAAPQPGRPREHRRRAVGALQTVVRGGSA